MPAGYSLTSESWLVWGQELFIASGVIWAVVLIPIQVWQARIARSFESGAEIPPLYWRLNGQWYIWGILATVLPLANLYVMVAKP